MNYLAAILLCVTLCLPVVGEAHGFGESFEEQVGDILVDIGYSTEEFITDTSTIFDFEILDNEGREIAFTDVWVRIVGEDTTVFASGIRNGRLGGSIMTYIFPKAGSYELSARFQKDGEKIAEATFPLVVLEGEDAPSQNPLSLLIVLFGVFAGTVFGFGLGSVVSGRMLRQK